MSRKTYERIETATPVDRTARRVTEPGEAYVPNLKPQDGKVHEATAPPPMRAFPKMNAADAAAAPKLGERFGRFVVIGYAARQNPKMKASWVVRCACGRYETRKARAIRNPANVDDCCRVCRHVRWLKSEP